MRTYTFKKEIAVYDNGDQISILWKLKGTGTLLRGYSAFLFKIIWGKFQSNSFDLNNLILIDSSINEEEWEAFINVLLKKNVLEEYRHRNEMEIHIHKRKKIYLYGYESLSTEIINKVKKYLKLENESIFQNTIFKYKQINWSDEEIPDLYIYLDSGLNIEQIRKQNKIASQKNVPFLSFRLFGAKLELGPLSIPGDTPCFECYWIRLQSKENQVNIPDWLFQSFNSDEKELEKSIYENSLMVIGTELLSLEVYKVLTSVPTTIGKILVFDVEKLNLQYGSLIEVSSCHVCKGKEVM